MKNIRKQYGSFVRCMESKDVKVCSLFQARFEEKHKHANDEGPDVNYTDLKYHSTIWWPVMIANEEMEDRCAQCYDQEVCENYAFESQIYGLGKLFDGSKLKNTCSCHTT